MSLVVVRPHCEENHKTKRLSESLDYALDGVEYTRISELKDFHSLQGKRILFAITQGDSGINLEYFRFLKQLRLHPDMLEGSVAGVIVDGNSELYTKAIGRDLVFTANMCGCYFPGRPFVEGTGSLKNFNIQAKVNHIDNMTAYRQETKRLVQRILDFQLPKREKPRLLVLHASRARTSNTYALWERVKSLLDESIEVEEISLRNGTVWDCAGCSYTACLHFGEKGNCFYGGPMVEQVYPALKRCDGLLMICPNYNDALSANLSAAINRFTALYRKEPFFDKCMYGIVVSGYSGSDLLCGQLISALNMNKSFILPGRFAMMETANDAGTIFLNNPGIGKRAEEFAHNISASLKGEI
jgi:multimeric flavodoxin WrbA